MHQPDKLKTNDYFPLIPTCFEPTQLHTDDIHEPLGNKPNDYHLFTPQYYYETEEVSSDKDVDEWLNEDLSKRMNGQDKEEEEDALIDILKTVVEIDVFRCEISLGVGNKKVKFDINGEICHSRVPFEKNYMVRSIPESEYFNPHEIENDDSPALEQRTFHYNEESVDTVDSSSDSQENKVGRHLSRNVSRWHVCKPVYITLRFVNKIARYVLLAILI
nr:hypothetical protein [Tanacetum cinerariifolium]